MVNYCGVELSSIYFDILKDRLYTAAKKSEVRRSSQTAMHWILGNLIRSLAPVLSFTSEEAWGFLPTFKGKAESVFLAGFPSAATDFKGWRNPSLEERFATAWQVRDVVFKSLEEARNAKIIGHPREARIELKVPTSVAQSLEKVNEDLSRLFLVSELELKTHDGEIQASVIPAPGIKCARCWVYSRAVGKFEKHLDVCDRCMEALDKA